MAIAPRAVPKLPAGDRGLAFQFGVVYRHAQVIEERAVLCAKLLEGRTSATENIERAHRILADVMTLHAAAERAVEMAEELD